VSTNLCLDRPLLAYAAVDLEEISALARRAALRGGEVVHGARSSGPVERKGTGDYVSEVDLESERAISELLGSETPDIPVVGEEEGGDPGDRYWLVDPLDGTTNFLHRFPVVGISVALIESGEPVAGCVHAPFLGSTWSAARGLGTWFEEEGSEPRRVVVSGRAPDQAIVATGYPFRKKENLARYQPVMLEALERFEDLRRPGAASLDLAWVASGVFDGFFELGLGPWDVAAGGLLIQEAGGLVTDWSGGNTWLNGDILAGSTEVHEALVELANDAV